jgi:hypothetical protein
MTSLLCVETARFAQALDGFLGDTPQVTGYIHDSITLKPSGLFDDQDRPFGARAWVPRRKDRGGCQADGQHGSFGATERPPAQPAQIAIGFVLRPSVASFGAGAWLRLAFEG